MTLTVTTVVIQSVGDVDFVERNLTGPREDQISSGLMIHSQTFFRCQRDKSDETERESEKEGG